MNQESSWLELVREQAQSRGDKCLYSFLSEGEEVTESLTYSQLELRSRSLAAVLQERLAPGDRVLLLYPPGLEFIIAFHACLFAEMIAVPAYPPGNRRSLGRLQAVVQDAEPAAVLTTSALSDRLLRRWQSLDPAPADVLWLATDEVGAEQPELWKPVAASAETIAFLQYTSGSTARPKGVQVTHGNLLSNQHAIQRSFAMDHRSVVVSWLPVYHDMGLIGCVLQPLYSGASCALMAPVAFLQRPLRWLQAITELGATVSGGPNFAYDLCVDKVAEEELEGVDLGSWAVAFNGAEPVRAPTLRRFAERFSSRGFRAPALFPCYGLAEATLFVAGAGRGRGAVTAPPPEEEKDLATSPELVSSGRVGSGVEVEVVDGDSGRPCGPRRVGEIWVHGKSVAAGYWCRREESEKTFQARLPGDSRSFLRTGDLGYLDDGELFVTGRIKDLIIVRGRNVYPQDLEHTAESSHPILVAGGGAAFGISVQGEERVVLVLEVEGRRPDPSELEEALDRGIAAISQTHEVLLWDLLLVRRGLVPKTSSGKVRRNACRQAYQAGALDPLARRAHTEEVPAGPPVSDQLDRSSLLAAPQSRRRSLLLEALRRWSAESLGVSVESVPDNGDLARLGLDSLAAVELQHRVERRLGVALDLLVLQRGENLGALATRLLEQLKSPEAGAPSLTPEALEKAARALPPGAASSGQKALWFLHNLAPESAAYHLSAALRLHRLPQTAALQGALEDLVQRHRQLSLRFEPYSGSVAAVAGGAAPELSRETAEDEEGLRRRVDAAVRTPFDLRRGPLLRARLIRIEGEKAVLVLTVHHVAADFWSVGILLRDLEQLYRRRLSDRDGAWPPGAEDGLGYRYYIARERAVLAHGDELWDYWLRRLDPPPPVLELPADRPRPPVQSFRGDTRQFSLPVAEGLARLTEETGATPFMILLTAFYALLQRLSGQGDLAVGTPVVHRPGLPLARTVGYCVQPLVLRQQVHGGQSFASLLAAVQETTLDALAHRDLPFPALADRLRSAQDTSHQPLFQALFVYHRAPAEGLRELPALALGAAGAEVSLGELSGEIYPTESAAAPFDLSLTCAELAEDGGADEPRSAPRGELRAELRFSTDLFDPATVHRMELSYRQLLASLLENSRGSVAEAPLLTAAQRHQLLREWQGSPAAAAATLDQLFARQAARTPEAVALRWRREEWSYRRLDAAAAALAAELGARGIGPGARVALCLRREPALAVALLAVLRRGAAYVPLDPAYPRARTQVILESSAPQLLITSAELLAGLPEQRPPQLLLSSVALAEEPKSSPLAMSPGLSSPHDAAYLIYTSGSTGTPKGVVISHRAAGALVDWVARAFTAEERSEILASTSVCFDLSVFELFGAWCLGGCAVLVDDVLALPEAPARHRVTLINSVPSAVRQLVEAGAIPDSVKAVNLAGEALPRELVERLQERSPSLVVRNLYGPSEDTTYSTGAVMSRPPARRPPIGRPVAGTSAFVLDRYLRPSALGVVGELFLAGVGLAQGYFGRPRATARSFLPCPFSAHPGERCYATGDLVRHLPGGELEFLGRRDHQVKVRGFRIELGEIEAALRAHPVVRDAVVAVQGSLERRRLVAFLESTGAALEEAEVRTFLSTRLPDYMLPSRFLSLDALPRTANGKVDRRRLPSDGEYGDRRREPAVAPRNEAEALIANAWEQALGVRPVGIHDNFFELGGNSLLATSLALELGRQFAVELPLQELFRNPTVADLALAVEERILDLLEELEDLEDLDDIEQQDAGMAQSAERG